MRRSGNIAYTGVIKNAYRILFDKPEWRRAFGRHRRKREDNIKMNIREIW
jgi:hypothetical protein